jgi:hypothetical protein
MKLGQNVILIGVTYALDLIETPFQLQNTIIMETGGMQTEMIREELHNQLCWLWGSCHSFRIRDD